MVGRSGISFLQAFWLSSFFVTSGLTGETLLSAKLLNVKSVCAPVYDFMRVGGILL